MFRWPTSVATIALICAISLAQDQPSRLVSLGKPRPLTAGPITSGETSAPSPPPSFPAGEADPPAPNLDSPADSELRPAAYAPAPSPAAQVISSPYDAGPPFSPPDSYPAPGGSQFTGSDPGYGLDSDYRERTKTASSESRRLHRSFFESFGEIFDPGTGKESNWRSWFQSDHCFDYFISPVTNPFLFEDPRSLTEVRPIFLIQHIPNSNPFFRGGNAEFFGMQARVAVTERFSMTLNKLGWTAINTGSGSSEPGGVGFSEIQLGPKFTFLRNEDGRMLGAAGIIFQIPDGRGSVYQDTGSLSIVPYFSFAKNFFETRFGSLNFMNTTGYSFATDRERTDYFYTSFHLDWDIANIHRFYPLLELSWFQYMRSGGLRPVSTEGRDLANIGSTDMAGKANFHGAVGMRYKVTESAQLGFGFEFPLSGRRDLLDYRFTIDFIWRY